MDHRTFTTRLTQDRYKERAVYKGHKRTKGMEPWNKFKTARVQVRKNLSLAEQAFINNILMEGLEKKDTKPFWK